MSTTTPSSPAPSHSTSRRGTIRRSMVSWPAPTALDATIAVVAAGTALLVLYADPDIAQAPSAAAVVVSIVASLTLVLRRSAPLAVVAIAILGRFFVDWSAASELALLPAVSVALYTVGRYESRRSIVAVAAIGALAMAALSTAIGSEPLGIEFLGELTQSLLPIAVGDAVQSRHRQLQARIDAEADARVQNERLRIARDLHDVVAHGLSVISIHSGVAARLLENDPVEARRSIEAINTTGKAALEELRAMVGVLRSTDEAELRPTPVAPDDLAELIETGRARGLAVDLQVTGSFPDDAADATIVATHRIVQEALTNIARHAGSVATTVRLDHCDEAVRLEILNAAPSGALVPVPSTGVGILGMQERAASLGASLHCGPTPDGGFVVRGVLPYRRVFA